MIIPSSICSWALKPTGSYQVKSTTARVLVMYAVAQVASSGTVAVVTPTFYAHLEGLPVDVAAYFKLFISFFYSSNTLPHAYDFRRLQILLQLADNALVTGDASWLDLAEYYASLSGLVTIVVAGFSFYYVTIMAVQLVAHPTKPVHPLYPLAAPAAGAFYLPSQIIAAFKDRRFTLASFGDVVALAVALAVMGGWTVLSLFFYVLMQAGTSTQSCEALEKAECLLFTEADVTRMP